MCKSWLAGSRRGKPDSQGALHQAAGGGCSQEGDVVRMISHVHGQTSAWSGES